MWRKCQADPVYFFEHFWFIQHPEKGAIKFDLFDAQKRALEVFQRERMIVTLKARQIGWTTLVAAFAFWETFFFPDRLEIFLSKGEREAVSILQKVVYGWKRLPEWMRARGPRRTNDNLKEFIFSNGSSIESLPSKSDPARGRSAYRVVVDEWGFLDNAEEAWASIEPVTDVGGRCIGLSTANGWGTFFHELWVGAETGTNDFFGIFEPWSARDDRDAAWYEAKKATLPEWQLHQEYPRNPEEAFLKSGNPFFDVDKLATIEQVEGDRGNLIDRYGIGFEKYRDGNLEVWAYPKPGEVYVIGADVAEGLEHGDYSSAHVKHIRSGEIVAHWHGHVPPDEYAEILALLGRWYNKALIGVENNNHGLTTCVALKQLKYPNIFYSKIIDERTKKQTKKIGWTTSRKTKPLMLDDLYAALRDDAVIIRDKETIAELRTFVRDENAKLHGSPYDDRTMSLAITEQMADYARQHDHVSKEVKEGSLAWWDHQLAEPKRVVRIGSHNVRGTSNGTVRTM